jgi:uncharacterized protein
MSDYRAALIDYIREHARPVEKFSHQPRLYELTRQIGAGMDYDDDVVFAAVWLHDIGVFVGHRPEDPAALADWDMVAYALKTVPGILQSAGFPGEKIPAVLEVIRTHQPADEPTTLEGTIHRDADILELLGATGILRTASKIGRDTRFHTFADVLTVLQRHLETLPSRLKLARSKELAEPRLRTLRKFLQHAEEEGVQ